MEPEPYALGPSHALILAVETRRLLRLHQMLEATPGLGEVTWFVVDLAGTLGRFCGDEIVGAVVVEHRLDWAARHGAPPSMCFPIDGPGAILVVEQLAPGLVGPIQRRLAGDIPIVIVDEHDEAALSWLHDLARPPARA